MNIKHNSFYDRINIPLPKIHFIIFHYICNNLSVDKTYIESNDNIIFFNSKTIGLFAILKIYNIFRDKVCF